MRRLVFLIPLLALLFACAPRETAGELPPAQAAEGVLVLRDESGVILLNPYLGLSAPPGSLVFSQRYLGENSESYFKSPEPFERVYLWLKRALVDLGWRVVAAEVKERPPDYFEARLLIEKDGKRKRVVLVYQGASYRLEVSDEA